MNLLSFFYDNLHTKIDYPKDHTITRYSSINNTEAFLKVQEYAVYITYNVVCYTRAD